MDRRSEFQCVAVVPAAGSGSRLRPITADSPKVLFRLETAQGPRSLISITVQKLIDSKLFTGIVVACSEEFLEQIKAEFNSSLPIAFVIGGKTRQESVFKALEYLTVRKVTHVAIHDAARPFVTLEALKAVVAEGKSSGAAILVERVTSTLKRTTQENEIVETHPRDQFTLAQTPQVFEYELILNAHREGAKSGFAATDDSQLVERLGIKPIAVINESLNPKVTEPSDLELARLLAMSEGLSSFAPEESL